MFSSATGVLSTPSALGRRTAFGVLSAIGLVLAAVLCLDIYADWIYQGDPLWSTLLENTFPLLLALALPYAGWRFLQNRSESLYLSEAARCVLFGSVGMILLSGVVMGMQVIQGEIKPALVALQLAAVGGIAGLWMGRNVARLKMAEQEARDDRNRLNNLLDGLPVPVVHGRLKGDRLNVLRVNGAFEEVFGHKIEGGAGENLYDLIAPEELRENPADVDRRAVEEGLIEEEVRRMTPEGLRDFQLRVAEALDSGASETYSVYTDITERKKREEELRLFEQVVEQANDAILVTEASPLGEPGPRIEYANPAFEEMTGYNREEIQGKTPRILQGPATDREVLDDLRESLENGESWEGEALNYRKDGEPYHLRWSIAPVHSGEGEIEHWMSVQRDVTRRRRREKALREKEAQLRGLTNSVPGAVFQAYARPGEEYGFYHVSEHAEDLLGISRDPSDFFARFMSRVPESAREDLRETINKTIDAGGQLQFESPFVKPSGQRIWIYGTATPEPREDEIVYNGVILDITERKVREEELRTRETQLQQIRENVTDVVWMSPADKSEIEFVSHAYEDIWGRPAEQLEEHPDSVVEAIHPDDRERVRSALTVQKESPEEYAETYRVVQPDGEIRWVRDRAAAVYGEDDQLEKIIGVATDITEAKEYELELETVNTRLQLALGASNTGTFDWDMETDEVYWDETSERLFGYEPGGFPETFDGWARRVHPDDLPGAQEDIERAIEAQEKYRTDFRVRLPDGTERWVEARGVVEYDKEDEPVRMIGIHTDVTERKEREKELREAKIEAEEASRLKSAMLANMSHEIRTPLTSITGFAELLKEELEGDLEVQATKIYEGGRRLARTLESVLHLSELEAGVHELEREKLALEESASEAVEALRLQAAGKSIELTTDVPDTPVTGYWNENALHRICRNLVENAIKFTPEGGKVELRVREEEGKAVLDVEDTGIGMDQAQVDELFEAFKQESQGLGREYEGTGLGLSIVKRLTEELGGSVEVETEKGKGSRFTVRLPLEDQGDVAATST